MSSTASSALLTCFAPVVDRHTEILILGSFPGEASLAAQQYYAHPQNQFWRLLSAVFDKDLVALPYAERLLRLKAHRIGLWDVIAACAREGSLDSAIRHAQHNDFAPLRRQCPALRRVCFNGKTSGKQAPLFAKAGFDTLVLPSSSPAYAVMRFEQKLVHWRGIIAQP
ncbi:DNA-deoxyinosine glycosylase [Oxalicibacterium flavum]|uniref:DNA-deoxyinosine glycosylase n=1 Tax=Oxalicibacterium flavum TaxID=179467 RepID=A0A8J2UMV6_9BURK|nr:DNA-deoxyinosine glycosylase [Oxalicibacterium flavum]GGC09486.1 DNA-deoxyinosine glycosylase [Oxalicibacterium flavum]